MSKTDKTQGRRDLLKMAILGGGAALAGVMSEAPAAEPSAKEQQAQGAVERATRGMPTPKIRDIRAIAIGGGAINDSMIVKVETDQAGLYGYGCATNTFPGGRAKLVAARSEERRVGKECLE